MVFPSTTVKLILNFITDAHGRCTVWYVLENAYKNVCVNKIDGVLMHTCTHGIFKQHFWASTIEKLGLNPIHVHMN